MRKISWLALAALGMTAALASADPANSYVQSNLTSDLPGVAVNQDTNLVNPWGIVAGPTTPFWVADNGTGLSTLYNGSGSALSLVVTVPPPAGSSGTAAPTGIAFNGTTGFGGSRFIFATEDGTISAWSSGTNAVLQATTPGAVYKGLAIGSNATGNLLYAANFASGKIDVFNSSFSPVSVPGGFNDPTIPSGFAPFDIKTIDGQLYVTYAMQDPAKHDDVPGPGNGFVDVFDTNGNLVKRLVTGGALNSPWGLTVAPSSFGAFGGDLLVGNFGDGTINAFNLTTGSLLGQLDWSNGSPIVNQGLWGLEFGNGVQGLDPNTLYFTAGIPGPDSVEDHGLFGSITATPEPSSVLLMGAGLFSILLTIRKLRANS
jgi:uncharacterized protein (TIGR03118 family)